MYLTSGDTEERTYENGQLHGIATFVSNNGDRYVMLHEKTKNFVKSQHKFDFTKSEIFYHFFNNFVFFLEKSEPGFPANWMELQSITTPVDQ